MSLKDKIQQNAQTKSFLPSALPPLAQDGEAATQLPLDCLVPWSGELYDTQPFDLYDDVKMNALAENIKRNGVQQAILVRPDPNPLSGKYQILAGHNRVAAARLAGLSAIKAEIKHVDDFEAVEILNYTNHLQRELKLSEKARSFRMLLDNRNRQGQRTDLTSRQDVGRSTADEIGGDYAVSGRTVQRLASLTRLVPALLQLADRGKLSAANAEALSHLTAERQEVIVSCLALLKIDTITTGQANDCKACKDSLDEAMALRIFGGAPSEEGEAVKEKKYSFSIPQSYFHEPVPAKLRKDEELQRRLAETAAQYLQELQTRGEL